MFQSSKIFIAREIMHKSRQYQISRYQIINNFKKFLKSDTPYCFAYISAPLYHTEKFLYSRQSYGSHLLNELCPSLLLCLQIEKFCKTCGSFFYGHSRTRECWHSWLLGKKENYFFQKAVIGSFYFFFAFGKIYAKTLVKKSQTRPVKNEKKFQGMGEQLTR